MERAPRKARDEIDQGQEKNGKIAEEETTVEEVEEMIVEGVEMQRNTRILIRKTYLEMTNMERRRKNTTNMKTTRIGGIKYMQHTRSRML